MKKLIFLLSTIIPLISFTPCYAQLPFVGIANKIFIVDGKPFRFIGANSVNLIFYDDYYYSVEKAIRTAKENNIIVHRLYMDWGYWKASDYDRILDIASKYGVYLLLTLTDCVASTNSPYRDFANEQSITNYKNRISQIILRKNTINGKIYRDDTTILGWDIANEPDLQNYTFSQIQHWISEISKHVKTIDTKHLVTIGIMTDINEYDQDGAQYDALNIPELDFFSFHFYPVPSNWNKKDLLKDYISRIEFRTKKFLSMGKPVLMEEFGFASNCNLNFSVRKDTNLKSIYCEVYKKSMDAAFNNGATGAMFWGWGVPEDKKVPLWWALEDHDTTDTEFCALIKSYGAAFINTDINDASKNSNVKESYKLFQNYPNPFNPITIINYSVSNTSFVTLRVYDILGKEIAMLVNEEKPIGNYEVEFDGGNLSSGIYFYRMQAGSFIDTKKLILLR
ncbi:MAG: cellulase family glycosylhydrolase [Melioribacteraceae bacterium]